MLQINMTMREEFKTYDNELKHKFDKLHVFMFKSLMMKTQYRQTLIVHETILCQLNIIMNIRLEKQGQSKTVRRSASASGINHINPLSNYCKSISFPVINCL